MHVYRPPHIDTYRGYLPVVLFPAGADVTVTTGPLVGHGVVVAPAVAVSVDVTPSPLIGHGVIVSPIVSTAIDVLPSPLIGHGVVVSPSVSTAIEVAPSPLVGHGITVATIVSTAIDISPAPIIGHGVVVAPVVEILTEVVLSSLVGHGVVVTPVVIAGLDVALSPLVSHALAIAPVVAGGGVPLHTEKLVDWEYIYDKRYPANTAATVGTPAVGFTWNTVDYPTVHFIDQSVGATNWLWDFAGRGSSAAQNPDFDLVVIGPSQDFAITLQINGDPALTKIHNVTVPGVASVTLNTLTIGQLEVLSLAQLENLILE